MNKKPGAWMRAIASFLCAALLLVSPGPSAYAAAAKVMAVEVRPTGAPATLVSARLGAANPSSLSPTLLTSFSASLAPTLSVPLVANRTAALPQLAAPADPKAAAAAAAPLSAAPAQLSVASEGQVQAVAAEGRLAAPAARARAVLLGTLCSIFSRQQVEDAPNAVAAGQANSQSASGLKADAPVQAAQAQSQPPAPAPAAPKKSKGPWLGLGIAGFSIIAYALTMQVGIEAQGVAMPQLTENAFKDFTLLPLVTVFSSIGCMIGQPMSKFFTERLGFAKTFYGAQALRAVSLGLMVALFGFGHMTMPLMMAFYLANGIVTGISATAEGTLRKLKLAEKGVSMQTFRTWWQFLAESLAVPAPIFFGALVHTLGAVGAPLVTAAYPVALMLGLLLAYILHVYPLQDVKKASAQAAKVKKGVWTSVKDAAGSMFRNMEEGKNYVMGIPYLKYSLMVAMSFDLFNSLIYRLIAPGYGKMTGGASGLSAVQGNMVGMFSLGGLLLSIFFITKENLAKRRAAKSQPTTEQAEAAARSSLLRWTLAGIPALALLAAMAFQVALPLAPLVFLGTNWMPASLLAAALIPFGFFQVAASIKANSYYQEALPADAGKVQKALAFSGSVATALSIVTLLVLRPLFSAVTVLNPFPYVALGLIPMAAAMLWLWSRLARATKPEAVAAADAQASKPDAAPRKPGAYVGMILGVVAAALVITALPMIPPVAALMAGWGVLGRFALNVALTALFPALGAWIGRARQAAK